MSKISLLTAIWCFELADEILGFTGRNICRSTAVTALNRLRKIFQDELAGLPDLGAAVATTNAM